MKKETVAPLRWLPLACAGDARVGVRAPPGEARPGVRDAGEFGLDDDEDAATANRQVERALVKCLAETCELRWAVLRSRSWICSLAEEKWDQLAE